MHAGRATRPQHHVSFAPSPAAATQTVPLSAIPPETLGVATAEEKAQAPASHASTAATSTTATGARSKAKELKLQFNRPQQVTGRATNYHTALAWAGRIGWCGKAVVYAMIGGLACQSAVGNDRPDPNLPTTEQVAASPQGAFVLLGATGPGIDIVILLIMMAALAAYILWRFWEGLAGQGYDETFSSRKNFFKFRLSPIVSGAVYVSYMAFLISVMNKEVRQVPAITGPQKEGWPSVWRYSVAGRVGLALLGIAFTIATCIQLQGVLTRQWHRDYRSDLPRKLMLAVFTIGHFGFAGRAGAFLAMAVMFFKDAGGVDTAHDSSMVADALLQLQTSRGLRAVLFIVGFLLIVYGLFATLSAFTRMFPTPPPSRRKRLPAAHFKQHQERKENLPLHHGNNGDHHQWGSQHTPASQAEAGAPPAAAAGAHNGSTGLAAAPLGASSSSSSIVDASLGWGQDQGLSNSSIDLDKQQQHPAAGAARPGSAGQAELSSGHPTDRFLVLPSQRSSLRAVTAGAGAAAAAAAEVRTTAGSREEPPVSPRIRAAMDGHHRAHSREFVTINF